MKSNKDLDLSKKIGYIPFDKIIDLKISGFFYGRIVKLFNTMLKGKENEFLKSMQELKTREPETDDEFNFLTILILMNEIEQAAKTQEIIIEKTIQDVISEQEKSHGN
jgi:hypothetical protein